MCRDEGRTTLLAFLTSLGPEVAPPDLLVVLSGIASAVKRISWSVKRASLMNLTGAYLGSSGTAKTNVGGDKQKKLDVLAVSCYGGNSTLVHYIKIVYLSFAQRMT